MKKKFLITSILSIVMCMSLIAGATFALFTSESNVNIAVTSGTVNVSASAEVVATYSAVGKDVTTYTDAEKTAALGIFENNGTAKVEDGKVILDRMTPGDRVDVKITVDNNSDVNVKHRTVISAYNDTGLFKGLKLIIAQGSQAVNFGGNVGVYYGMYNTALATDGVGADIDDITVSIALPDYGMSGVDNEYQNTACEINFKIEAVQGNADVETVTGLKDTDGDGYLEINNKEELVFFATQVNGGSMTTNNVELMANIDLGKMPWSPIGPNADVAATKFYGIFEGNGYTISNLYVNQGAAYHAAGLFGALSGTAKNFTVDGAYINSISSGSASNNGNAVIAGSLYMNGNIDSVAVKNAKVYANRYVGGIAGYVYGNITNCTVEDIELVSTPDNLSGEYDNGDKVGGIAGYFAGSNNNSEFFVIKNNSVKKATLTGYRDIGGAVGSCGTTADGDFANNDVQNITIIVDRTNFYGNKDVNAAYIIGRKSGTVSIDAESVASGNNVIKACDLFVIQNVLDNAKSSVNLAFTKDVVGNINIQQKTGIDIVIDGANNNFNGTFYVDGGNGKYLASYSGTEIVKFINVKFVTETESLNFIDSDVTKDYAHNIIVENCSFTATGAAKHTAKGLQLRQDYRTQVINSTGDGLHSLLWATGADTTLTVDGVTLTDCKNGISVGTVTNVIIKNTNISATGYGIRADGAGAYKMTITDCNISAAQPVIVRKLKAAYTLAFSGTNTLTATGSDVYQVILTNDNDDVAYATPTGVYTLTGADLFNVYK